MRGIGTLLSPNHLEVVDGDGSARSSLSRNAIIAAGSEAVTLPFLRTIRASSIRPARSNCASMPKTMLVIGGGIIGLEMATVYSRSARRSPWSK